MVVEGNEGLQYIAECRWGGNNRGGVKQQLYLSLPPPIPPFFLQSYSWLSSESLYKKICTQVKMTQEFPGRESPWVSAMTHRQVKSWEWRLVNVLGLDISDSVSIPPSLWIYLSQYIAFSINLLNLLILFYSPGISQTLTHVCTRSNSWVMKMSHKTIWICSLDMCDLVTQS